MRHAARRLVVVALAASSAIATAPQADVSGVATYEITSGAISVPLDNKSGDAARGRAIVLDRRTGNCLICHKAPEAREPFQGDLGPDLAGVGARLKPGELRLRLVDQSRLNPATIMPPYHRVDGLNRVGAQWRGKPVLDAQAIEDVVAYLLGLKP